MVSHNVNNRHCAQLAFRRSAFRLAPAESHHSTDRRPNEHHTAMFV